MKSVACNAIYVAFFCLLSLSGKSLAGTQELARTKSISAFEATQVTPDYKNHFARYENWMDVRRSFVWQGRTEKIAPAINQISGGLQQFDNQADFDAAAGDPGAFTVENFNGGSTAPDSVNNCNEPLSSISNDACFTPGQLAEGFAITTNSGLGLVALGSGFFGPDQSSVVVGANAFVDTTIVTFNPPVIAFSMDVYDGATVSPVLIEAFDADDNPIGTLNAVLLGPDTPTFAGAISDVPVARIVMTAENNGGEVLDNLRFAEQITPALAVMSDDLALLDMCNSNPGQDNGVIEPGETVDMTIPIFAAGASFDNVTVSFTPPAPPGITYLVSSVPIGNLAQGSITNAELSLQVDSAFTCLSDFSIGVLVDSDQGNWADTLEISVGKPDLQQPMDVPVAITDADPAGITSTIDVDQDFLLAGLSVRVDIPHTWVGEVTIFLTSPAGTTITLLDRPGVPNTGLGCDDDGISLTFSDGEADPELVCSDIDVWPVTAAAPVQPLSAFNGENVIGPWILTVSDSVGGDTGQIVDWELLPTPSFKPVCMVCGGDDTIFEDGFESPTP
jgi:subtilisin-like proprotein convertase family protein